MKRSQENKPYNDRYETVKDKDRFLRKYESQLILFSGAERMLQRDGIAPARMNVGKLKQTYNDLLSRKNELFKQHKTEKAEIAELELIRQNMEKYLNIASPEVPKELPLTTPEI